MKKKAAVKRVARKKNPLPPANTNGLMGFGGAIFQTLLGEKVAREGWNGKGMFIIWVPGSKVELRPGSHYKQYFPKRKTMDIDGHFDMFTAQRTMQPGWLASQADMVAKDWVIVK